MALGFFLLLLLDYFVLFVWFVVSICLCFVFFRIFVLVLLCFLAMTVYSWSFLLWGGGGCQCCFVGCAFCFVFFFFDVFDVFSVILVPVSINLLSFFYAMSMILVFFWDD